MQFKLPVRTLQRRLKMEGTTYKKLLEEIRKELAKQFLYKKTATIEEIAQFLGYAEASAFRRAFKRWTGVVPSNFLRNA